MSPKIHPVSFALGRVVRGRVPTLTIDVPARVEVVPQRAPNRLVRAMIIVSDAPPHIHRCLFAVICVQAVSGRREDHEGWRTKGHRGEHVVHDVEVGDVVEEHTPDETQEIAVDGGRRTTCGSPCAPAVHRDGGVDVVQKGDHDHPVVHEQPGHAVNSCQLPDPDCRRNFVEGPECYTDSEIGEDNRIALVRQKYH